MACLLYFEAALLLIGVSGSIARINHRVTRLWVLLLLRLRRQPARSASLSVLRLSLRAVSLSLPLSLSGHLTRTGAASFALASRQSAILDVPLL